MNNKILKKMREAHLEQADRIKKLPGYEMSSEEFNVEYAVALELFKVRKHARLSQKELAKRLHTTQSVISRMESGEANITLASLNEYVTACGGHLQVKVNF